MSRTQFSLRTLLAVIAAFLAKFALSDHEPHWATASSLVFMCMAFTALLATGARNAGGYLGAFCYGGLIPAAMAMLHCVGELDDWRGYRSLAEVLAVIEKPNTRAIIGLFWVSIPAIGLLCVAAQWLLIRPREPKA